MARAGVGCRVVVVSERRLGTMWIENQTSAYAMRNSSLARSSGVSSKGRTAGVLSVAHTRKAHLNPHSSLLAVPRGIPTERVASAWRQRSRRRSG
eukprot:3794586-Pleurochrysis_carterae.AAC.1